MKIGLSFPTMELQDPGAVREFAQGAEELGFHHLTALEHVLGTRHSRYTPETKIHEPLVLFSHLAAVTTTIQFATSILVLPQRQAVLVARQAAELDLLSNGRVRLGIGLGGNDVEATGVGSDFHTRGARVEEQVDVMRALWTQEVVTFHGRWHNLEECGIMVLPVQRPIPLWMGGGHADRTLERIGRMADGWVASTSERGTADEQLAKIRRAAQAAGRAPDAVGVQGRMPLVGGGPEDWLGEVHRWQELGATHLAVNTSRGGFNSPAEHLRLAERFMSEVGHQVAS